MEFWTEAAERTATMRAVAARGETRGWWSSGELGGCLEEVFWTLREGGWAEEEVREMMMIDGVGGDYRDGGGPEVLWDREGVVWHVRLMSLVLLRAGWTREDVVYSLGLPVPDEAADEVELLELRRPIRCLNHRGPHAGVGGAGVDGGGDHHTKSTTKQLMRLQSLEV